MKRAVGSWVIAALILALGCKKEAPAPVAPPQEAVADGQAAAKPPAAPGPDTTAPVKAAAPDVAAPVPDVAVATTGPEPDPGPALTMASGPGAVTTLPDAKLTASAQLAKDGHLYLAVPLGGAVPNALDALNDSRSVTVDVIGTRAGAAALSAEGGAPTLYVRLVGEEAPETLSLRYEDEGQGWREQPHATATLVVTGAAAAPAKNTLQPEFWRALAASFERRGRVGWRNLRPFHAFAAARAQLLAGSFAEPGSAPPTPVAKSDLGETMSLYTGMLSVDEALQTDRGLLLRNGSYVPRTILISDVQAVPLASHPWDELQKQLGRAPAVEPLAAAAPADMLYVHFTDLRTAVKLMGDLDEWVTPVAQMLDNRPGANHLAARYEEELMVERLGLAETLGHIAADGVAFVAGDPFFREGTDVAILFRVKERSALLAALGIYEAKARERHPDLVESTYTVGTTEVRVVASPDRAVHQHRADFGDVLVVANSASPIRRIAAAREGTALSLAKSPDFQYFRSLYPFAADEDGFLFLSDAFVAHAVSPTTKILAARRVAAAADLQAVASAALLHGWLEGKPPSDAAALVKSGLLKEIEQKHGDGTPIAFDPARGPSSGTWGRLARLTPLSDLSIGKVSTDEQAAYDRFRETYQTYWRRYIDPIGVRIDRSDDGKTLRLDARMLPLLEGSEYDQLIEAVGTSRVVPPTLRGSIFWTMAVGRDTRLRRELDELSSAFGDRALSIGWLGDWVAIGTADRSGLWDMALHTGLVPEAKPRRELFSSNEENASIRTVARLPIFVGAHVRNPLGLAATLTALRTIVERTAPGLVDWASGGTYRDVAIVAVRGRGSFGGGMPDLSAIAIHYATAKDVFLASLDKGALQSAIDAVLDGKAPQAVAAPAAGAPPTPGTAQADLRVTLDAGTGWTARTLLGLLELEVRRSLEWARRDVEALARGLGGLPADPDAFRAAALGYLGYEPRAVQGGAFTVEPDGQVRHSLYGTEAAPLYPAIPLPDAPITKLVEALDTLGMGLSFEGEGASRGLHAVFEWKRR